MKKTRTYRHIDGSYKRYGGAFGGLCLLTIIVGIVYSVRLQREIKATEREIAETDRELDSIRQELGKRKGHIPRYFKMGPAHFRTPQRSDYRTP